MNDNAFKYDFYEVVSVVSTYETQNADDQLGAVLGRIVTEEGKNYYTVLMYRTNTTRCLFENEMTRTGTFAKRSDFFDGRVARVQVDENGSGSLASEQER